MFVAVHVGAGRHGSAKEKAYRLLCKKTVSFGLDLMSNGLDAQSCAVQVCKVLEDDPLTNAAKGSQLNYEGEVECDACIMESKGLRGAGVGAINGIKNPIEVADLLLKDSQGPKDRFERTKPMLLVGKGAKEFALRRGCVESEDMVTAEPLAYYTKWKAIVEGKEQDRESFPSHIGQNDGVLDLDYPYITDTVGVICCDPSGLIAVAASSGGVALKHPGRIGPASLIGSGVSIFKRKDGSSVTACTSGHGEDIILSQLASTYCRGAEDGDYDSINRIFESLQSSGPILQTDPAYVGILSAIRTDDSVLITYAHTTESMIFGYGYDNVSHSVVSHTARGHLAVGGYKLFEEQKDSIDDEMINE